MQFLDTRHFLSSVCKPVKTFTLLEKHSPFFSKSTYSNTPQQLILNMNCFYHVMLLTIMVKGSNLMVLNNIPGIKNSDQKHFTSFLEDILDSAASGIIITDNEDIILYANHSFLKILR